MSSSRLNRRTLLRGVGAFGVTTGLGLPLLDSMLNDSGTALAQGTPLPVRVGVWFWGNGVRPEHFFPDGAADGDTRAEGTPGTTKEWDPAGRQHTAPLAAAALRPYVSLVSGTQPHAQPVQSHHDGKNAVLTGSYEWFNGDASRGYAGPITPSFDQIAAQHHAGQTPFQSLVLGIQEGAANNEPGNSGHFTSSTGRNRFIRPEYSPLTTFRRLFTLGTGMGPADPTDEATRRLLLARRSILDAVAGDVQTLNRDLGARDRQCLEQHLTGVRILENRIASALNGHSGSCDAGETPEDFPTIDGVQRLRDRNRSMSDVLALALACDLTRAFSYQFTVFQTGHDFGQEPELNGSVASVDPGQDLTEDTSFHEAAHFLEFQDAVRRVTNFTFDNFAYLLTRLAEIPEGDGSVLSNSAILATTEHTEPMSHVTDDMPMVMAGGGGGRLLGGRWYHGRGEKVSKGGLTVLRAAGIPVERFGTAFDNSGGEGSDPSTTETFTSLET
ncbi:MAG: DUF1552 domain-containing protein [Myxococcota bacterium]